MTESGDAFGTDGDGDRDRDHADGGREQPGQHSAGDPGGFTAVGGLMSQKRQAGARPGLPQAG
jgi:hypothetical protein